LLDRVQQPIAVLEHDPVELAALVGVELTRLQRLEIEPNRGDRRLQFMGDGVQEGIVLLVPPDLPDQENRVEDHAGDDQQKQDDAQDRQDPHPPVEDNPADIERDGNGDKTDAEDGEEDHLPPAAADHGNRIQKNAEF
jgi:hypothetical protein